MPHDGPKVPWIDLRPQTDAIRAELEQVWASVMDRGAFAGGPETARFEEEWARYLGVRHAIGCSDGTTALYLALRALELGAEDEVITAPTSFVATAEAIVLAGARPAFADVDHASGNLDPAAVEAAVNPRTRAIVAVHLGGRPAPMHELGDLARRHGLRLLEDAAQAHGATYHGAHAGALGEVASFSFYPTKNLGAFGEAGAVTTDDDAIAARVRMLLDHGQASKHRHELIGTNARLDGLQGAVLRLKLRHLDRWVEERRALAERYRQGLEGLPLGLPTDDEGAKHVYHLFTVRTRRRDDLARTLAEQGIASSTHYPTPIHLQPAFAWLGLREGSLPRAERYAAEQLSLPLYPGLPPETVDRICEVIRSFWNPEHG